MRVNVLVAGTQKGGTTALARLLSRHPQVRMARTKEVHYFDADENFAGPGPDYARYHDHFDAPEGRPAVGEATPIYMYWDAAPARIAAYNPGMRLILSLRDPAARAWSHYRMERARGAETLPFGRAIREEADRCRAAGAGQHRVWSYVGRGFYSRQIGRLLEHFPREQMLFLRTERLSAEHDRTLHRLCTFLDLRPFDPGTTLDPPQQRPPMDPADEHWLRRTYHPELDQLEELLGWDCSDWRGDRVIV